MGEEDRLRQEEQNPGGEGRRVPRTWRVLGLVRAEQHLWERVVAFSKVTKQQDSVSNGPLSANLRRESYTRELLRRKKSL